MLDRVVGESCHDENEACGDADRVSTDVLEADVVEVCGVRIRDKGGVTKVLRDCRILEKDVG